MGDSNCGPTADTHAAKVGPKPPVDLQAHSVPNTECSAVAAECQVAAQTECSAKVAESPKLSAQLLKPARPKIRKQVVENTSNVIQLSAQLVVSYDRKTWKRSRIRTGWLIRRMSGYSIAETEYGISYLWVLSRKPDRTSADNSVYPLAGYFNWKSLESSGLLRKERRNEKRDKAATG